MLVVLASLYLLSVRIAAVTALPINGNQQASAGNSAAGEDNLFPTNIGYLGPTRTAGAPFLAQTDNAAPKTGSPTQAYFLPQPIETSVQSSDHKADDRNIFELFGTISPYYVGRGWGVFEYGLPGQCHIDQVHVLSRHGTRYSTDDSKFPDFLKNHSDFKASGDLDFLNSWKYDQGSNILTTLGNQQLFDKGARTFFRYGRLFDWDHADGKFVARSTTQERMTMSAEYFLIGFFGTNWQKYANLELLIEADDFNNTLASYDHCPVNDNISKLGLSNKKASNFLNTYLKNATERFNSQVEGLNFTAKEAFQMQQLCTYEANNLGFSKFCNLFTQQEWEDYEYYLSWTWYNDNFFGAQTGRALGIGWVEEFKNRLTKSAYDPARQALQNSTLDQNSTFFPLDQKLYFDFTHDSVITNIYAALGFEQFKSNFSDTAANPQPFDLSTVVPFASQTYFEVIDCDSEVPSDRHAESSGSNSGSKRYIHVILNDHTLPLHKNFPEYCEERADGWCEFDKFVEYLDTLWDKAQFNKACFAGGYDLEAQATDGVPVN